MFCYRPTGLIAVNLTAIGQFFPIQEGIQAPPTGSPVATIIVRGPLAHHEGTGAYSYDLLKKQVKAALESPSQKILLSIDSPGGDVSGLFDTITELKALSQAFNKPIFSYIDGTAVSAGYALCLVGQRIFTPSAGVGGSLGVYQILLDATAQDSQLGLKYTLVYSGARKVDTNPHHPKDDQAIAAMQAEVDTVAGLFFQAVVDGRSTYRPDLTVETVRSLQAGMYIGNQLIDLGLADQLATEDEVIQLLSDPTFQASIQVTPSLEVQKMANFADAVALLQSVIDDPKAPEEDKEKAKAAIRGCSEYKKAEVPEEKKPEGEASQAAEGEPPVPAKPKKDGEPDGDEAEGKKALRLLQSEVIDLKRTQLLASRSDLTPVQVADLQKQPLNVVKYAIENLPRASTEAPKTMGHVAGSIAALNVQGQPGNVPPTGTYAGLPADEDLQLKAQMGITSEMRSPHFEKIPGQNKSFFVMPAMNLRERQAYLAARVAK
jgi:ClpP class serine protease